MPVSACRNAARSFRSCSVAALCAVLLAACGNAWETRRRIDAEWFATHLIEGHAARWLAVAPTPQGFLRTAVTRDWRPAASQPGGLVAHTRTIYVFAAAYELTGNPAYLEQVRRSTDFLLKYYLDPEHGGWYEAVAPDGKMTNPNKRLYSQAFALFALAHAHRASRDVRYRDAAAATWHVIRERYQDKQGGFRAGTNRDFSETKIDNTQNPLMHLFEALLAFHDAGGGREALQGAAEIARFVTGRLLQANQDGGACIPELYDDAWRPLDRARGGLTEIGHQFEWAFLLSAGVERGLDPSFATVADQVLRCAITIGLDRAEGGVFSVIQADGEVDRRKWYWQQAEALRALMHHAALRERGDLWGLVTQMNEFVRSELVDERDGGWYLAPKSQCARGGCADSQPDGYHMTTLYMEAIRVARRPH
jgi:mannose/cellobiose epimerase-like protein (N-acyl-D-glucosamine 2-epimerase family)